MKTTKYFLLFASIVVLVATSACSKTTTTSTTAVFYPPAISDLEITLSDTSSGINVNMLARTLETNETSPLDIVYYYDATPPTTQNQPAYTAGGTYFLDTGLNEPVIWKNVPAGMHTFSVQLVNEGTETPFDPPLIARSTITIPSTAGNTPEIRNMSTMPMFLNPAAFNETPQTLLSAQIQIACILHNFKVNDDNIGKKNVPGEGHLIYYMDVQPPMAAGQPATTAAGTFKVTTNDFYLWENVLPGTHTFYIQIVNNDNTPLDTPVFSQMTITIPSQM